MAAANNGAEANTIRSFFLTLLAFMLAGVLDSVVAGAIGSVLVCLGGALDWSSVWVPVVNAAASGIVVGMFFGLTTLLIYRPMFNPGQPYDVVAHKALDVIQAPLVVLCFMTAFGVVFATVTTQAGKLIWTWPPLG